MKKLPLIIVTTLTLCFALQGCGNKKQKQAIAKIDSLIELNTKVYDELSAVETDSIKIMYDSVKKYDAFFASANMTKNIDDKTLLLMYEYGTIDKTFKKFIGKHYEQMFESLKQRRKQLENLKQDIENGLLKETEVEKYLKMEDSLMNFAAADIRGRIDFVEQHKQKYYRYHPEIVKLVDSIENHK